MKTNHSLRLVCLIFILNIVSLFSFGQGSEENRDLTFTMTDLKIIRRADSLLKDKSVWSKQDDRRCDDDIAAGKFSLYCALYKASVDVAGEYVHRRPAMQVVRFTLEKYESGRVKEHRLMDWNNHPDTNFEEVKKLLKESIEEVSKKLNKN